MTIGEDKIAEIRQRCSIVEVISQHVGLKRVGRNQVGLCPFHAEKTPSFTVNEERGIFHCFGCGVGGDVFGFVMRLEGLDFPEAVRSLARRCGVVLPAAGRRGDAEAALKERLLAVNEAAARFFAAQLADPGAGVPGRRYLERRGIGNATREKFRLGYAPGRGEDLVRFLRQRNLDLEMAVRLGLVGRASTDGRYYDRLRDRLIFPVSDLSDRVVGFGSRLLGQGQAPAGTLPKYLNSPETPVFRKGRYLYGLAHARAGIRAAGRAVIVEGYFDVLTLFERGIDYAVASLGTALTPAQVATLGRFTRDIVACFDGDAAGEKAAMRSLGVFLEAGLWGGAAFLPAGEDPDSFVRKQGRQEFEAVLAKALPLLDFFLARVRPPADADPGRRGSTCRQVASLLGKVKDPFAYDAAVKRAAETLGVSEALLRKMARGGASEPPPARDEAVLTSEECLVRIMLTSPAAIERVANSGVLDMFEDDRWRAVGEELVAAFVSAGKIDTNGLLRKAPPELAARIAAHLLGNSREAGAVGEEMVEGLLNSVRRHHLRRLTAALRAQIREAEREGDTEQVKDGLRRLERLVREQRELQDAASR